MITNFRKVRKLQSENILKHLTVAELTITQKYLQDNILRYLPFSSYKVQSQNNYFKKNKHEVLQTHFKIRDNIVIMHISPTSMSENFKSGFVCVCMCMCAVNYNITNKRKCHYYYNL